MKNFNLLLVNFLSDESGQDLIEYALVASVIALGAITTMGSVATAITTQFTTIAAKITAAPTT
jgi:pilus assembly protein Flp/PilA